MELFILVLKFSNVSRLCNRNGSLETLPVYGLLNTRHLVFPHGILSDIRFEPKYYPSLIIKSLKITSKPRQMDSGEENSRRFR